MRKGRKRMTCARIDEGQAGSTVGLIGANILVVEDNPSTRELMASLLKRMGSEVVTAGSAQEALRHLSTDAACDLVLADIVLPGASGLEVARSGRRLRSVLRGNPLKWISGRPYHGTSRWCSHGSQTRRVVAAHASDPRGA